MLLLKSLGENKPCPNRIIYILSWLEFLGGSESGMHVPPLCHIRVEQTKPGGNPISGDKIFRPNRKYYISSWPEFWGGSNCLIRNLKFDPQNQIWPYLCSSHMIISHYREIWPPPMIYTSFWPDFQGDSESGHQNLKFNLWHLLWLFVSHSHILEKCDLHQSWWSIYHPDWIFKEILNLVTKFWNSICGSCYGYIYSTATLQENLTITNQDDLYIIWTRFLRGFWIQSQKFEITSGAYTRAILVFQPHYGKIWPPPISMIYISSGPDF